MSLHELAANVVKMKKIPVSYSVLTLSQTTNFRLIQSESLQTKISNLKKNDRKFSKQVENTVRKGEIARYKQFLLLPQCFQKTCTVDT